MDVFPLMSTAIRLNDFARGSREVGPSFEDSQSNQFRLDQICQIIRAAISDNPGVQHHLVAQRLFDIADKIQRIDKDQGPKHYWRAIADDVALLNSTLDDLQNKSVQFPQLMPFYRFLRSRHLAMRASHTRRRVAAEESRPAIHRRANGQAEAPLPHKIHGYGLTVRQLENSGFRLRCRCPDPGSQQCSGCQTTEFVT